VNTNISLSRLFANSLTEKNNLSDEALSKASFCLLDFLACTFSTQHFPWVQQAQRVACLNSEMASAGAPIIGTSFNVSRQDAAFVNAVAGHSLVRDDMHVGSVSHLGVAVLPTALALAEHEQISGREFLEAVICGYEAGGKLGALLMDVETAKTFRPTGLIGAFASAATAARIAKLNAEQTANALGFAANYITGLNEWAALGSDDMYFHPGIAGRNGITAMLMAREGASAAEGSLDGKAGLFAAFNKSIPTPPPLPFSHGEEILQVFFKQVPACNYAQTAAQAALQVKAQNKLTADAIEQVTVKVPYAAANYPGCDYPGPFNSILQARMSIHFNVASALLNGNFEDSNYHDFNNTDITQLIGLIDVSIDQALTDRYPEQQGAAVIVTTKQGKTLAVNLDDVITASDEEVSARFLIAAGKNSNNEDAATLYDSILGLAASPSLDSVLPLLVKK
jgi:2-methylcitrate dehydratase PrpD